MNVASRLTPTRIELVPWTDRRGRFHPLRAMAFALLVAPMAWLAVRGFFHILGAEPLNAAIHSTGFWAVWLLLFSLTITPLRALASMPSLAVLRRMTGNAALVYALVHLGLYATDQNWRMWTIASEILRRFYLTIGFVALTGLCVLGFTSTDGWARKLGAAWKRIHRVIYAIAILGLVHYLLQSKLDVSASLLAAGVYTWLMLWRFLPIGRDREWLPLAGASVAAALLTLAYEYAWYRFGTRADPVRVVSAEADVEYGLHPACQVLLLGMLATGCAELRRLALGPMGQTIQFTMGIYALGAFVDDLAALFMGWSMADVTPRGMSPIELDVTWVFLFAALGATRWKLRDRWQRKLLDAVWVANVVFNVVLVGTGTCEVGLAPAALVIGVALLLGQRVWLVSRMAALLLVPLGLLLAYEATVFLWFS